ncbi:LysR substrate-binding domain-containing protein [Novosphingobium sp. Gsoil 351]|uniref:LysR family transcriptional regulator n=1 Tax=Novosphingobium sp. Gsoil 351 TaxID=2675225 RepID=UPI0018A83974|nr:LysR substrate-binding domain-containing protein [Novosphingobium sp. Gsoil 351]
MKRPNLRAFDLNLLPILDALLDERSVSLAADRINLSQSATSSALLRLREMFNDPIVIREGQRMVPSTRALLIRDQLKAGLATITDIIVELRNDARETGHRQVTLAAPEHIQLTMLEAIQAIMIDEASDMDFKILTLDQKEMIAHLDQCKTDIAMGSFGSLSDKFNRKKLYKETMVAVMRKNHPALANAVDNRISMADFKLYPHLVVSNSEDISDSHLSTWLASKAVKRKVTAVVQHISMITQILRDTDFICLGTERSFRVTPESDKYLDKLMLPAELATDYYLVEMVWHDRTSQDVAIGAVRDAIHTFCKAL